MKKIKQRGNGLIPFCENDCQRIRIGKIGHEDGREGLTIST